MKRHRRVYKKYFGEIPTDENGRTFEIHHKDGNNANNHPDNLVAVSIQEHFDIHWSQEDWAACAAIAKRMLWDNTELNRLGGLKAKENRSGIHGLSLEQRRENGKRGAEKTKGYVRWNNGIKETAAATCPGPEWKRGSLPKKTPSIKPGTKLGVFWNDGSKNKRSETCPGEGWVRGKVLNEEQRKRRSEIGYIVAKLRWDYDEH